MNIKRKIYIVLSILIVVALIGCNIGEKSNTQAVTSDDTAKHVENSTNYPVTIIDSKGNEVVIEREPQKVVSMAPNITETIYALNRADKLIGRTDYCNYPKETESVASVGNITEPNVEVITELKPDIVIASTHFNDETEKQLTELGIKVVILYSEDSFEGVYSLIEKAGLILNAQQKADEIVSNMEKKVQGVLEKVDGREKPSVYYVVGYGSGDFTAGRGTFIAQMIEMAGAENAADDVEGWTYSLEKLVEKDPDILLCSIYWNSKEGITNANGYKDLTAVKEGRLFEIDNDLLDRQGPRLVDGLEKLAEIIHPEAFK